jgi:hypothetical protein
MEDNGSRTHAEGRLGLAEKKKQEEEEEEEVCSRFD